MFRRSQRDKRIRMPVFDFEVTVWQDLDIVGDDGDLGSFFVSYQVAEDGLDATEASQRSVRAISEGIHRDHSAVEESAV